MTVISILPDFSIPTSITIPPHSYLCILHLFWQRKDQLVCFSAMNLALGALIAAFRF